MRYFLVLLDELTTGSTRELGAGDHDLFVDFMLARNVILLGGGFDEKIGDSYAAYVLVADDGAAALAVAAEDPLMRHGHVSLRVVEWQLVGINRRTIDPAQVLESAGD